MHIGYKSSPACVCVKRERDSFLYDEQVYKKEEGKIQEYSKDLRLEN
jgi:hypothetical protein